MKKKALFGGLAERKCQHCSHDGGGCAACEIPGADHAHSHEGHEHIHGGESEEKFPKRLIIGAAIFAAAIWLSHAFELPRLAELLLFGAAYIVLGIEVLFTAFKNLTRGQVFDENFLMTVATIGAFILGDYAEGAAVMLFYLVGETLSDMAVAKSRRSITDLMDIRPDYANLETDGKITRVSPKDVQVGQTIIIEPFEKVPLDGTVLSGNSAMNTSALTGESAPRDVARGTAVLAGFVNGSGRITVRVDKPFGETAASKILDIVQNAASKKAATEKFITKFARIYTPIVCAGALAVAVIPSLVTGEWGVWVSRALIFLVISCPCALVVSVPLSYFGGIGGASKKGVLIKGAVYIDKLAAVREVVFDKTGTLTKGVFDVREVDPAENIGKEELLYAAACAECRSSHPIAKSVLAAYGKEIDESKIADFTETPGFGVKTVYQKNTLLAGSAKWMKEHNIEFTASNAPGTILYVAQNGGYLGSILISDVIKPDAKQAAADLKAMGINTAMLTGDNTAVAKAVASEIGIDTVYSELLPQDKVNIMEKIEKTSGDSAFVGDGVNDAPVLTIADIGIAMGALGSDAAIEAADVVLMTDEPKKVPLSIKISKKTKRIVWQNIIFALAVKAVIMVLGVMGAANMNAAVFADVGVTLIAVLNALRALKAPE